MTSGCWAWVRPRDGGFLFLLMPSSYSAHPPLSVSFHSLMTSPCHVFHLCILLILSLWRTPDHECLQGYSTNLYNSSVASCCSMVKRSSCSMFIIQDDLDSQQLNWKAGLEPVLLGLLHYIQPTNTEPLELLLFKIAVVTKTVYYPPVLTFSFSSPQPCPATCTSLSLSSRWSSKLSWGLTPLLRKYSSLISPCKQDSKAFIFSLSHTHIQYTAEVEIMFLNADGEFLHVDTYSEVYILYAK